MFISNIFFFFLIDSVIILNIFILQMTITSAIAFHFFSFFACALLLSCCLWEWIRLSVKHRSLLVLTRSWKPTHCLYSLSFALSKLHCWRSCWNDCSFYFIWPWSRRRNNSFRWMFFSKLTAFDSCLLVNIVRAWT